MPLPNNASIEARTTNNFIEYTPTLHKFAA
jgi:hypothetical protein